jgi:hypothetical protein
MQVKNVWKSHFAAFRPTFVGVSSSLLGRLMRDNIAPPQYKTIKKCLFARYDSITRLF